MRGLFRLPYLVVLRRYSGLWGTPTLFVFLHLSSRRSAETRSNGLIASYLFVVIEGEGVFLTYLIISRELSDKRSNWLIGSYLFGVIACGMESPYFIRHLDGA